MVIHKQVSLDGLERVALAVMRYEGPERPLLTTEAI